MTPFRKLLVSISSFTIVVAFLWVLDWKYENRPYAPSSVPDRIILTLSGNPATERAVSWRTDNDLNHAVAQIAIANGAPDQESRSTTLSGVTALLNTKHFDSYHHHVVFQDLIPNTQYIYRVGDGASWSEWLQFRTSSNEIKPFSFIYLGDAQNDIKSRWSTVIRQAFRNKPNADFILHAGDLVNNDDSDYEWGQWFDAGSWINGVIPSIATPGNHEYSSKKLSPFWRHHFVLPENGPDALQHSETVYYVDYQGTRFISLDTNAMEYEKGKNEHAQKAWLEKVLSDNPNRWTVIFHHHPMHSGTTKRPGHQGLQRSFKSVYEKYNVDLVLQGHDHGYARGSALSDMGMEKNHNSPMYVVSVSGPKMYEGEVNWAKVNGNNKQLYQVIDVDYEKIVFRAYLANGELFDAFVLVKDELGDRSVFGREKIASLSGLWNNSPGI